MLLCFGLEDDSLYGTNFVRGSLDVLSSSHTALRYGLFCG